MQYIGFAGSSSHPYSSPQHTNEIENGDDDSDGDHMEQDCI